MSDFSDHMHETKFLLFVTCFPGESAGLQMVSCGADKSIYFQTAEQVSVSDAVTLNRLSVFQLIKCSPPVTPDCGGFVILQESSRGGEDHAVRHGSGLIKDTCCHCLSGPKRQVKKILNVLRDKGHDHSSTHGVRRVCFMCF